jgi:hypothetical protein
MWRKTTSPETRIVPSSPWRFLMPDGRIRLSVLHSRPWQRPFPSIVAQSPATRQSSYRAAGVPIQGPHVPFDHTVSDSQGGEPGVELATELFPTPDRPPRKRTSLCMFIP